MNYTNDRCFVDTNILVCAHDLSSTSKREKASSIVRDLWRSGNGVVSTQVLQEFFVTVTQKIPNPIPTERAGIIVSSLGQWHLVINDLKLIEEAIDLLLTHEFSFWDALIITSALQSGAHILLSEDLQHEFSIDHLTILNPFLA